MILQHRSNPQAVPTRRATRSAFTLLEVLIVVAIIVMLSGAGSYFFFQQYEEAKTGKAKMDTNSLSGLADTYRRNHNHYPADLEELTREIDGYGPYCSQKDIIDPWGKPYKIDPNGPTYGGNKADIFTTSPKGVRISN